MALNLQQEDMTLEKIIVKSSKIRFRSNAGIIWYTTTVDSINEDEITLAFPEAYAAFDVILEDILIFKYTDGEYECSFKGRLEQVNVSHPQYFKIKVTEGLSRVKTPMGKETKDTLFLANLFEKGKEKTFHSVVCGVADTMLRVISKYHVAEGEEVDIHITLPFRNMFDSIVKLKGEIIASKPFPRGNEYEIRIIQRDDTYEKRLLKLMEKYG